MATEADNFFTPIESKFTGKAFAGHAGRPGQVGGSRPRGGGGETQRTSAPSGGGGGGESTGPNSAVEETLSRTPKQRKADIRALAKKPLSQLRKEQSLIEKQIQMAYQQRNDRALEALQQRQQDYTQAVMLREFG